ncbi:hypothetical protein Tco_0876340 [Tanacetum coccineum]|uniref:Reverse transcriptase domain-containing protein n=1 Tax=Tanacetum coccineum TaxID=301880 RepID=A0ABQ5BXP5_9ASTR
MLIDLWDPELLGGVCYYSWSIGYEVGDELGSWDLRRVGPTQLGQILDFADTLEAAPGRRMSRELGYGIRDTWDDLVGAIQEIAPTTLEGVNQRVIELSYTVDEEVRFIYSQLDDARYDRALLRARVNMLESDRPFHGRTAVLMEEEARLSRAAWAQSMDACDQTHSEGILLRTTVMTQQSEIVELRAADQRRQTGISNEIKKIETELWNLKVQGTDVVAYNQRFQELALLSDRMFPEEADKIERYVGGMPDPIYSSVVASKPKTMQEAIEMGICLMERRLTLWLKTDEELERHSSK